MSWKEIWQLVDGQQGEKMWPRKSSEVVVREADLGINLVVVRHNF